MGLVEIMALVLLLHFDIKLWKIRSYINCFKTPFKIPTDNKK